MRDTQGLIRPFKALQELQEGMCFRHFVSNLRWFLEDEPKLAGGLETGFGVQVHPGLDHRWHSEVCDGIAEKIHPET